MYRCIESITKADIEQALEVALQTLQDYDDVVLQKDANERAISHRLAVYLEKLFPDWNVDCEYNRNCNASSKSPAKRANGNRRFPDIIVHRRETNENLLVIEMKKTPTLLEIVCDATKLRDMKQDPKLHYRFAVFISIQTRDKGKCGYEFF